MWKPSDALVAPFLGELGKHAEAVEQKQKQLAEALAKNKMWHGSLGVVKAMRCGDALKCFGPLELDNEPGACAWMFNARLHQRRYGASAYPMPGVASLFVAMNGPIYVQVSPLAPVLGKGIVASD